PPLGAARRLDAGHPPRSRRALRARAIAPVDGTQAATAGASVRGGDTAKSTRRGITWFPVRARIVYGSELQPCTGVGPRAARGSLPPRLAGREQEIDAVNSDVKWRRRDGEGQSATLASFRPAREAQSVGLHRPGGR